MEGWISPSASVRRRRGVARDVDVDTSRRYEHTEMKAAVEDVERLEGVDGGRVEDVQMVDFRENDFDLPVRYKGGREGI